MKKRNRTVRLIALFLLLVQLRDAFLDRVLDVAISVYAHIGK